MRDTQRGVRDTQGGVRKFTFGEHAGPKSTLRENEEHVDKRIMRDVNMRDVFGRYTARDWINLGICNNCGTHEDAGPMMMRDPVGCGTVEDAGPMRMRDP